MVIEGLDLMNFRGFRRTAFLLGERTLVTGPNGAGKSSISDALAYLATGACRGTTSDGKGIETVIRLGENEMVVAAIVAREGVGEVERGRRGHTIARGPRRGEMTYEAFCEGAEKVLGALGVTARQWELAVRPDAFLGLHEREQATILCELAETPLLTLEALLAAGAPPIQKEFAEALDGTFGGYCECEKRVRETRRQAGRRTETAKGAWKTAVDGCVPYDARKHAKAREELEAAQSAVDALDKQEVAARGDWGGRRSERSKRVDRLERELEAIPVGAASGAPTELRAQKVAELEAAREASGGWSAAEIQKAIGECFIVGAETTDALTEKLKAARKRLTGLHNAYVEVEAEFWRFGDLEQGPQPPAVLGDYERLATLIERAESAADGEGWCYACEQPFNLEAARVEVARIQAQADTYAAAEVAWKARKDQFEGLGQKVVGIEAQTRETAASVEGFEKLVHTSQERDALRMLLTHAERAELLEVEIRRLDQEIADAMRAPERLRLEGELAEARAALAEIGEFVSPVAGELDVAATRRSEAFDTVRALEEAEAAHKRAATLRQQYDNEAAEHSALDELVEALAGPLRWALLEPSIMALQADLSAAMHAVGTFTDGDEERRLYDARVGVSESGWLEIRLVKAGGDGGPEGGASKGEASPAPAGEERGTYLPLECASESEQLRVRWALQCVAGLRAGIVVLDAPECLDDRFAFAPYALGGWLAEQGVQVILCALPTAEAPPEGWKVVRLEDGAVLRHGPDGATQDERGAAGGAQEKGGASPAPTAEREAVGA
jgi:energy-coupling factor transporter ATP-binding protein EcfA2